MVHSGHLLYRKRHNNLHNISQHFAKFTTVNRIQKVREQSMSEHHGAAAPPEQMEWTVKPVEWSNCFLGARRATLCWSQGAAASPKHVLRKSRCYVCFAPFATICSTCSAPSLCVGWPVAAVCHRTTDNRKLTTLKRTAAACYVWPLLLLRRLINIISRLTTWTSGIPE